MGVIVVLRLKERVLQMLLMRISAHFFEKENKTYESFYNT
ncbi:hypothetical protein KP78_15320 [Jeotgalibacillus soli]|uniref:Uncharacterized protein n=1 Tax=Jeotgalibacillus soli TaxID=889306 RepID=A0A0C2S7U5_9BACL|nr:hypothetical protein KP78_15320 [Jeotgalibacillus soli]